MSIWNVLGKDVLIMNRLPDLTSSESATLISRLILHEFITTTIGLFDILSELVFVGLQ